jgi:type I restriction enzyme R subunit
VEDVEAQTFASKVEGFKLEKLGGRRSSQLDSIVADVARIPESIIETEEDRDLHSAVLQPLFASALPETLDRVIVHLAKYMNRRTERLDTFTLLDLRDVIAERSHIVLDEQERPVYAEAYREQVQNRVNDLVATHPAVQTLLRGRPTDSAAFDLELLDLERLLRIELGGSYLHLDERNIRRAYQIKVGSLLEFVGRVLELPTLPDYRRVVERQFEGFLTAHPFNGDQTRFLKTLRGVILERKQLNPGDLYDAPAIRALGKDAADRFFTPEQLAEVMDFGRRLSVLPKQSQNGA